MKQLFLSAFLLLFATTGFGQTLFFDDLPTTVWQCAAGDPDAIWQSEKIGLSKQAAPGNEDALVWKFGAELTISRYDAATGNASVMLSCPYTADRDKGQLTIFPDGKTPLVYEIGITSTGNFALLMKRQPPRERRKLRG